MRNFIALVAMFVALVVPAQKQRFMYDGKKKIYYNTVADAENRLIQYIEQHKERYNAFPERYFTYLIENDERCLTYDFSKFEKAAERVTNMPFRVRTSEDGALRLYSWDISGGTMSDFSGITSYKDGNKVYSHSFITEDIDYSELEAGLNKQQKIGSIACGAYDIKEVELNDGRRIYVVFSFSSGSSILYSTSMKAYTISNGELKEYSLFVHGQKRSNTLTYYTNPCSTYFGDIKFDGNDLYIPETRNGSNPYGGDQETGRRLYYQFDGKTFNYTGINYPDELHSSLRNFKHNIVLIEQAPWKIRIDRMPDGKTRYASWKGKESKEVPDMVIKNGTYTKGSTGKNSDDKEYIERYTFSNGEYTYEVSWKFTYQFTPTGPEDWKVTVKRKGKVLMTLSEKKR